MKKYQWNDAKLQKKANWYSGISLSLGVIALGVFFSDASVVRYLIVFIGIIVCQVLLQRVLSKDKQLKPKGE